MVGAALADGTAGRDCVFEVFARRLPHGRRYGVWPAPAGCSRRCRDFRFGDDELAVAARAGRHRRAAARLAGRLPVQRRHRRLRRGRALLPGLPGAHRARRRSPRACCWRRWRSRCSTTTARSPRPRPGWSPPPASGPCIEMGSRRTHEEAAVAAARAAYLAGFASTSNLEAGRRYGVPTAGTSAHAFTLLHDDEAAAFRGAGRDAGHGDHAAGRHLRHRRRASAPRSRSPARSSAAIRLDSGDLPMLATPGPRAARRARRDRAPGSSSPATSTSTRSPRWRPRRSTATASAPRWSPARARRRPAWSTSWSSATACRWRSGRRARAPWAAARTPSAGTTGDGTALAEVVSSRADRAAATATATSSSRWCGPARVVRRRDPGRGAGSRPGPTTSGCGRRCRRRRGRCPAASRRSRP